MTKLTRELVHSLKNRGKTFSEIGRMYGVSKQYAWGIYSGYYKVYEKTDRYKMYKRHSKFHFENTKRYKPCDYCESMEKMSTGVYSENPSI